MKERTFATKVDAELYLELVIALKRQGVTQAEWFQQIAKWYLEQREVA